MALCSPAIAARCRSVEARRLAPCHKASPPRGTRQQVIFEAPISAATCRRQAAGPPSGSCFMPRSLWASQNGSHVGLIIVRSESNTGAAPWRGRRHAYAAATYSSGNTAAFGTWSRSIVGASHSSTPQQDDESFASTGRRGRHRSPLLLFALQHKAAVKAARRR